VKLTNHEYILENPPLNTSNHYVNCHYEDEYEYQVQENPNDDDEVVLFREHQSRVHRVRFEGSNSEVKAVQDTFNLNHKLT
jgi:hypothetical protein